MDETRDSSPSPGSSDADSLPSRASSSASSPPPRDAPSQPDRFSLDLRAVARGTVATLTALGVTFYGVCVALLVLYTVVDPITTGVQLQRRAEAWIAWAPYDKRYTPISLDDVDDDLELAVVAAEDTRFFEHGGIDWEAIQEAIEENQDRDDRRRGGSTISQQLAKNLFLTTHSTYLRKGLELPLTYLVEWILSKERILELYVNVIEWGPGVYGIEAATRYHYDTSADQIGRYRAAALAACIPNPLDRRPQRMDWYTRIILRRMNQIGSLGPYLSDDARPPRRQSRSAPSPSTRTAEAQGARASGSVSDSALVSDGRTDSTRFDTTSRAARVDRLPTVPPDSAHPDTSRIAW